MTTAARPVELVSPAFIVFEGLDGSGKTTSARRTAEALGGVYLTTPSERVRAYRDDIIDSYRGSQEAQQLFYLSTVFAVAREVAELLEHGKSVVLDRYFLSTQAYAEFRGSRLACDDLEHLLLPADLTVFLDVPLEVRRRRVAARGASAADHETLSVSADLRLRGLHSLRGNLSVVGRYLVFDAGVLATGQIVERVIDECFGSRRKEVTR